MFGSATLALFMLQIATGICLALVYVPSADEAYQSLEYLNYQAPFGWYLRAMHFWGSNAMVAVMTLHMIQVFLFGAHKYPRETDLGRRRAAVPVHARHGLHRPGPALGSGRLLGARHRRLDRRARRPCIGEPLVHVLLGGPIIAGRTLSRFFTLHVFAIPGLLIALVGLHLWLVLRLGINEWPMPGRLVNRETYRQRYEEEVTKDGVPFFPDAARKDMVAMGVVVLLVLLCAAIFGPHGPQRSSRSRRSSTPRRSRTSTSSRSSALFALLPPCDGDRAHPAVGPPIAIGFLFALPFFAGTGEKSWKRRPVAVLGVHPDRADRDDPGRPRRLRSVVAGHGRVERGADAGRVREGPDARSSSRARWCSRTSSAAPATASAARAASAVPPSTAWPRG